MDGQQDSGPNLPTKVPVLVRVKADGCEQLTSARNAFELLSNRIKVKLKNNLAEATPELGEAKEAKENRSVGNNRLKTC